MTNLDALPWADLVAVGIRTTSAGPFDEDVFWQFLLGDARVEIPGACIDRAAVAELHARLPGLDSAKIARAMGSTRERIFRVWHRAESRFRPGRDALGARFRALVGKLGGDPEAIAPAFDRLYAAWSVEARRYHDLEHLVDCLRELDAANAREPAADRAELALWYHDVVYEPGAHDCEERSARALEADAVALAIPELSAKAAANLVRATAHAGARDTCEPVAAELVRDIDLSILGRDALRFMDYEYGVEEEYGATPTIAFRCGRGRFLAALQARDSIFRGAHFRARYEQRARVQIEALLASPRYRSYRWLRWAPPWRR